MVFQTVYGKDRTSRLVTSALVAQIPLRGPFRPRRRNLHRGRNMRLTPSHIFWLESLIILAFFPLLSVTNARGQAPPGPLPQTPAQDGSTAPPPKAPPPDVPRTKVLAGTWRLNLDESDDPGKKLQQARGSDSSGQGGGRRDGGGMGGGGPGGGGMGGGGGVGGGARSDGGGERGSGPQTCGMDRQ